MPSTVLCIPLESPRLIHTKRHVAVIVLRDSGYRSLALIRFLVRMTGYHSVICKVSFTVANLLLLSLVLVPRAVRAAVIAEVLRLNVLECRVYEYTNTF